MQEKKLSPIHPGEILLDEFLRPMAIDQRQLAQDTNIPSMVINQIIHGNSPINANIALRLSKFFGIEPEFWLNLQNRYDLDIAEDQFAYSIENEVKTFQMEPCLA